MKKTEKPVDWAAQVAIDALTYLAEDPERLERFLDLSGLEPGRLRQAAAEPGFLPAVLDHCLGDERLLLDFAASRAMRAEAVAQAREQLAPTRHGEDP